MKKIKVLISDFQFLTRQGLINLLSAHDDFELLEVVEGQIDLVSKVIELQPDVLILDYKSQDPILISSLKKIMELGATHTLIITNDDNKSHIRNLLDMGIKGIVTKSCSKLEITNAIYSIAQDNRFFCNRILDLVMNAEKQEETVNCDPADLSPREYEVLQLIVKGQKTIDIADKLHVSVHTINSHRKSILKKLNVKSPAELIVYAMGAGIKQ